ncbi:hypothetical protein [Lichenibacterium dinghuense]|uniref:hypothetical protein n=1 Tax=Lichenibacterium dinghuense TaxID=2895977 RepID=UPI001F1FC8E7|nr:hypothetical protein [Lichenibacterium sp. 6Y81]
MLAGLKSEYPAGFVGICTWIGWNAPRIADFAQPGVAWYDCLSIADLPFALVVLAGGPLMFAVFAATFLSNILLRSQPQPVAHGEPDGGDAALWWAGGATLAAVAVCLGIAMLRPTLTYRYLTPFAPGIMLLAAAAAVRQGRAPGVAAVALAAGALVATALTLTAGVSPLQRIYNFEVASAWLAEKRPSRLVFFWDHPSTPVMARSQLDAIGGFFLRRAGLPVEVIPIRPTEDDMNGPVLAAAGPDAAVIWMYDVLIHRTSAGTHPPRLSALAPRLECRNFAAFNIGVVACRQRS